MQLSLRGVLFVDRHRPVAVHAALRGCISDELEQHIETRPVTQGRPSTSSEPLAFQHCWAWAVVSQRRRHAIIRDRGAKGVLDIFTYALARRGQSHRYKYYWSVRIRRNSTDTDVPPPVLNRYARDKRLGFQDDSPGAALTYYIFSRFPAPSYIPPSRKAQ